MRINIDVSNTIAQYEERITKLKEYLDKLPKGQICAHRRNGKYLYCLRTKNKNGKRCEKYLSSTQNGLIKAYCESVYLRKLIPAIEKELKVLKTFERNYKPNSKYEAWNKLPQAYKQYANQIVRDNKTICHDWEYAEFEHNGFPNSAGKQYITKKGEIVRSRIELIIADMLYDLKISYRYEQRLDLPSGAIYPDFTILHPETLELYYIEIFGMMDNPEYEQAAFSKIAKYAASKYYNNLIMFFDHNNSPISTQNIKKTLEIKFLSIESGV